tara:strand:+ start:29698 stop:31737 length:2040 start_codon:yes stop_codon:yes gene_type:complete
MFSSVEMSKLTMAGSIDNLDNLLRKCADLGHIHIKHYSEEVEGITVGTPHPDADEISTMLAKVRSVTTSIKCSNKEGPIGMKNVQNALNDNFSEDLDFILNTITQKANAKTEISKMQERIDILSSISALDIPLELMTGVKSVEVYLGTSAKASKVSKIFSELIDRVELHVSGNVIAVACQGKDAAEVQMAFGELGAKSVQIPTGEGKPSDLLSDAIANLKKHEDSIIEFDEIIESWASKNGRILLAVEEHLERESDILTGHTLCATSAHAYALEAWLPSEEADKTRSVLSKFSSHIKIEQFTEDHGHGHDDHDHHSTEFPPIEYDTIGATRHASALTNLVGRPKYGSFDPTSMIAFTFPIFYGLILGDAGYGLMIMLLALLIKSKIGHDPMGKVASRILMNMGIATFIVGVLTAEAFGFVIEKWDAFVWLYEPMYYSTKYIIPKSIFGDLFGLTHTYLPFHRAAGALQDYILLSIYLGCAHLLFGFLIGFYNVFKAHGIVAAFFEKGSWLLILIGGSAHILRFLTDDSYGTFEASSWSIMVIVGVLCLIYGLAVYENFGWLGGIIMGPIETFGLLANTLSYLRIMAVGVAGVKIAEIGNEMGFHSMADAISSGEIFSAILFFFLWIGVQVFALALGLLSPSIHAIRLHFVEWMGKFYDGSGEAFSPIGGRPLHVEGHTS